MSKGEEATPTGFVSVTGIVAALAQQHENSTHIEEMNS
jgi:hypothetical protein